jgi:hypothetical protein
MDEVVKLRSASLSHLLPMHLGVVVPSIDGFAIKNLTVAR